MFVQGITAADTALLSDSIRPKRGQSHLLDRFLCEFKVFTL